MNLAATLNLNNAGFLGPLGQARAQLAGFRGTLGAITGWFAPLAALGGVSLSVAGAVQGLRDALDLGGRLNDLEARTGIAVDQLVVLEQAFRNAGISAESVGPVVNLMQRALSGLTETGEATEAVFARLGLNMSALRKESPVEQLRLIAERIAALPDVTQRSAAAMKIFGRSGAELLPFLRDASALRDAATTVGKQAELLARNAAQFDRASDILAAAPTKLRGFFVGAAESISASLLSELEKVNQFDFSEMGQRLGQAIAPLIEAFKSGALGEVVELQLTRASSALAARLIQLPIEFGIAMQTHAETAAIKIAETFREKVGKALLAVLEVWNKMAPKALQVPIENKAAIPARGIGEIFMDQLSKKPSIDLPKMVDDYFDDAVENMMKPFRAAAEKNRAAAQNITKVSPDGSKLGPDLESKRPDGKGAAPYVDRLTRIGGFIGAGGPALNYARRTAEATMTTAELLRQLVAQRARSLATFAPSHWSD